MEEVSEKMTAPVFSIVTPMYKGEALISKTIDSVLAQDFTSWEMIIVDDASPDGGAGCRIVESYAQRDSRIRLIASKVNKGSSGARNEAMRNAKGRYFAFLDSDDIWHEDYLSTMKMHIDDCTDETVAVFFSGYRRMDSTCSKEILPPYEAAGIKDFKKLLYHCPIFPSAAVVDTERLSEKVFFREELKSLRDDYVFWLDILKQGKVCMGYDDILVDYRMRDDSMTSSKLNMIKPQWKIYRSVLHLNFFRSVFYLFSWALNGVKKYKKCR